MTHSRFPAAVDLFPQTVLELFTTRIKDTSAYFDRLVALIPAKFYLAPSAEEEERNVRAVCLPARLCTWRLHLVWPTRVACTWPGSPHACT